MTTTATNTVRVLGLEPVTEGWLAVSVGLVYLLTACCKASAKGSGYGVVCRACYQRVDERLGMAWTVAEFEAGYLTWLRSSQLTEGTPNVFANLAAHVAAKAAS